MIVRETPNGFIAESDDFLLKFTNITTNNDHLSCTLRTYEKVPYPEIKYLTKLNLLSGKTINETGDILNQILPAGDDWKKILRQIATKIAENILSPFKPEKITFINDPQPHFLVQDFIIAEVPNIIFAPGGRGKSLLALFLAICVENKLNFFGSTSEKRTLYLDWETDLEETKRRATLIKNGLEEEDLRTPDYLRMYARLIDTIDAILEICTENGYQLVIVDSAACAIGGDINSAQEVIQFFSQIRRLNAAGITTLIISHVSKREMESGERTPIGSVYFENFPRVSWELRSEYAEEYKKYRMGLFCRKTNVGPLKPIGLEMVISPEAIYFTRIDPNDLQDTRDTVAKAILLLLSERPATTKQIAEELSIKPATARVTLYRLREQKRIERYGDLWRLSKVEVPF